MPPESCRLCRTPSINFGQGLNQRLFLHCENCDCVFSSVASLLSSIEEKQRYLQHNNQPTPQYEDFLNRLVIPVSQRLRGKKKGLDFGSGPVPVLSQLLKKHGHTMVHYDPYFFPERALLEESFDFITCCETAEHFHHPEQEFVLLDKMLQPGGYLGLMTQMQTEWTGFFDWYYPRDPTHVMFYSPRTMEHIAARFGWEVEFLPQNVVIFRKAL